MSCLILYGAKGRVTVKGYILSGKKNMDDTGKGDEACEEIDVYDVVDVSINFFAGVFAPP